MKLSVTNCLGKRFCSWLHCSNGNSFLCWHRYTIWCMYFLAPWIWVMIMPPWTRWQNSLMGLARICFLQLHYKWKLQWVFFWETDKHASISWHRMFFKSNLLLSFVSLLLNSLFFFYPSIIKIDTRRLPISQEGALMPSFCHCLEDFLYTAIVWAVPMAGLRFNISYLSQISGAHKRSLLYIFFLEQVCHFMFAAS